MSTKKIAQVEETEEIILENEQNEEKGVFKLRKPIMVNGDKITEIPYDFGEITAKDIILVSRDLKSKGTVVMFAQFDDENLLSLFAKAVAKCETKIILNDLLRLSAKDTLKITALVRRFFYGGDSEDTREKTS